MDKNLKTCLIIGAALVFVAGLVMVGAFTLIYLNRDKISDELEQWTDQMEATGDDGRAFGETADQQGCVEADRRQEQHPVHFVDRLRGGLSANGG